MIIWTISGICGRGRRLGAAGRPALSTHSCVPVEPFPLAWKPSFLDWFEIVGLKVKEEAAWQQLSQCQLQILLFHLILFIRC